MGRLAQTLASANDARRKVQHYRNPSLRKTLLASGNEIPEQPTRLACALFHGGANSSEVCCWLALRASVLRRRANSWASTAQERRAEVSSNAVSQVTEALHLVGKQAQLHMSIQANHRDHRGAALVLPKKRLALCGLASPMVHGCQNRPCIGASAG